MIHDPMVLQEHEFVEISGYCTECDPLPWLEELCDDSERVLSANCLDKISFAVHALVGWYGWWLVYLQCSPNLVEGTNIEMQAIMSFRCIICYLPL